MQQTIFNRASAGEELLACGVECLECDHGECVRYNYIGGSCLVLLVLNLLALLYCFVQSRKLRRNESGSLTSRSLLTESSMGRSTAGFD